MERTEYKSAASMPKWLAIAAIGLCLARGADLAVQAQALFHPPVSQPSAIHWQKLTAPADQSASKAAPPPPPPEEMSPAVKRELEEISKVANSSHKILLYQFYANWSDPCKRMDETTMHNTEVASVVDKNFLPVLVRDMQHEQGRNSAVTSALFKKYRVFAFPTLVAVGPDGDQVGSLIGSCSSLTTYRFLTRIISKQQVGESPGGGWH